MSTNRNNVEFVLELLTENEAEESFKEATSATTVNPAVTWAKFILTDDLPNRNKQRVPHEEFGNLIRSGIYMPIKMARGVIKKGHELSEPLGTITNLKEEVIDGRNTIVGLAALWSRERPEDVSFIKAEAAEGRPLRLSWEILYKNSAVVDGIEELHDVVLKASTLVGIPAYDDRTPILAIAAYGSPAYLDELGDDSFLLVEEVENTKVRKFPFKDRDGNLDKELLASSIEDIKSSDLSEEIKASLIEKANAELSTKPEQEESTSSTEEPKLDELEQLRAELEAAKKDLATSLDAIKEATVSLEQKEEELAGLRLFKASVEEKEAKASKLQAVKEKFAAAKISKDEKFFEDNAETLLKMSEEAFDFMLQELVAFSSTEKPASASVPSIVVTNKVISNAKELADELRKARL